MNNNKTKITLPDREIKFRVWNNKTNKWQHGGPHCHPDLDGVNLFGETILLGAFMPVPLEELNDCVALQYTGLKDKNGKEIFEGDIVRTSLIPLHLWQVKFGQHTVSVGDTPHLSTAFGFYFESANGKYTEALNQIVVDIIGNIFENSELIEN
jgi:hypothetical protein